MFVLGIETTCDETACAIVKNGREICANVIYSQVDLHNQFGGVFPELACRRHVDILIPTIEEALSQAQLTSKDIGLIAVAKGPGLIGALLMGLSTAKSLSFAWEIPYLGINHVEAHLYAAMMPLEKPQFPALGVVISGGHTLLVLITDIGSYTPIGTTADDAIGEAFDKAAAMLGLSYPGGPAIEALARQGDPHRFPLKAGKVKERPWDFSFSGLKTNLLYTLKNCDLDKDKADLAASFQEAALKAIVEKTQKALTTFPCKAIYFGGGVSNNRRLRALMEAACPQVPLFWPPAGLSLDNAAMIAGLAYHQFQRYPQGDSLALQPKTRIPL